MDGSEFESLEIFYPFLNRSEPMGVVKVLDVQDTVTSDYPATLGVLAVFLRRTERKARISGLNTLLMREESCWRRLQAHVIMCFFLGKKKCRGG